MLKIGLLPTAVTVEAELRRQRLSAPSVEHVTKKTGSEVYNLQVTVIDILPGSKWSTKSLPTCTFDVCTT